MDFFSEYGAPTEASLLSLYIHLDTEIDTKLHFKSGF